MKIFYYLLIIIIFSSCYSAKKAQKEVIKAHLTFPKVTSNFCAETFPVKESVIEKIKFIKGKEIIKTDTITVNCDEVVRDSKIDNKVLVRYKTIYQTDTIVKEKTKTIENTAKIKSLQLKIVEKETEIAEKQKTIDLLKYLLGASIIALLLLIFIKK